MSHHGAAKAKDLGGFELDQSRFIVHFGKADARDEIAGLEITLDVRSQFFWELNSQVFLLNL